MPTSIYTIPMRIMPKLRPRSGKYGVHNDPDYTSWKEAVSWQLLAQHPDITTEPLAVDVIIRQIGPKRADADNACGGALDSANGILWKDDRQIQALSVVILSGQCTDTIELRLTPLRERQTALAQSYGISPAELLAWQAQLAPGKPRKVRGA